MAEVATSSPTIVDPRSGDGDVIDAILSASRAMMAVAARSLAMNDEDVTLPQYRTLVVLAFQGPRRLADLAEALQVSPSTATRMCDRLVRKGLIDRTRDEFDRREVNLALTETGRQLVTSVIDTRKQIVGELLAGIGDHDRASLISALGILTRTAGESPEPHWSLGWME